MLTNEEKGWGLAPALNANATTQLCHMPFIITVGMWPLQLA
jgi:hypothetical protein